MVHGVIVADGEAGSGVVSTGNVSIVDGVRVSVSVGNGVCSFSEVVETAGAASVFAESAIQENLRSDAVAFDNFILKPFVETS